MQYHPGKTIQELAAAGRFRNAQISVTTDAALIAAGVSVQFQQWDGTQWNVITDWIAPAQALVGAT